MQRIARHDVQISSLDTPLDNDFPKKMSIPIRMINSTKQA